MNNENKNEQDELHLELEGKPPSSLSAKSQAYDDLQKKIIDVLIDAIKYIASSCGIVIALYSQILQGYLRDNIYITTPLAKGVLIAPLILWLMVIISTIVGIFPRDYNSYNDLEKQLVIQRINKTKKQWLVVSLVLF
jgi:hypothetical protein